MHPRVPILIALCAIAALPAAQAPPASPSLRFVPGSTVKVTQLIGDEDKERHQPTTSRTLTRYGIEGTDLGNSFEHDGRVYFLFGDTLSSFGGAPDVIGITDARDPESGLRLDFLTTTDQPGRRGAGRRGSPARGAPAGQEQYLRIQPAGVPMGAFEVPVAGISLGGRIYVVVSTNHSDDRSSDQSVLTRFKPPSTFEPGRTISRLPDGHFVKMSLHAEPSPIAGLPPGGPFVLMWGTGHYRKSDAYFAVVPAAHFEDGGSTRYFAGLTAAGAPSWSEREADAVPVARDGSMGDVSVTWCQPLGLWLMTYDTRATRQGIAFSYSRTPWGPWSEPQTIFDGRRDGALGRFIHDPRGNPPDNLVGPVIGRGQANPAAVHGGAYAPYVVERWTKVDAGGLNIYYVLSTWNPYVVVLMRSRLRVE